MPNIPSSMIECPTKYDANFLKFGTFEIADSYIGSGGGVVFVLKDVSDNKHYEVSFRSMKDLLNGVKVVGSIAKGPTYNFKIV